MVYYTGYQQPYVTRANSFINNGNLRAVDEGFV